MSNAQRFPLQWPHQRPRTPSYKRKHGRFSTREYRSSSNYRSTEGLTINQAVQRLQDEVERIAARDAILSSNLQLRLDGMPKSGQAQPADPGVCLYFTLKGKPHALPCDRYTQVEQNIAALAAHLEATRAIERHGVADMAEMFTGFQALPAPGQDTGKGWRTTLGFTEAERPTRDEAEERFRKLAREMHPDRGGEADWMANLNAARDQMRQELKQ